MKYIYCYFADMIIISARDTSLFPKLLHVVLDQLLYGYQ